LQPVQVLEAHRFTRTSKLSHNSWMPEKAVLPQTHLIRYAPKAQDT